MKWIQINLSDKENEIAEVRKAKGRFISKEEAIKDIISKWEEKEQ